MSKKKQTQPAVEEVTGTVVEEAVVETVVIENLVEAVVTEKRRGRPVVEGSARQLKLAAREARAQMNNGVVKRGRPVVINSARQQKFAEREAKRAAGIEIKRGRPKAAVIEG